MKICVPSSAGGHFTEVNVLKKFFEENETFYVVPDEKRMKLLLKNKKAYFVKNPGRKIFLTIKNIFKAYKIMRKEMPQLVVSTGASVAIPYSIFGKLFGAKLIFIESICRTKKKSFSGRIMYHFSDLFFVQWEKMKKVYPKAAYAGRVF